MKILGTIIWHFPFFGFVSALFVAIFGLILTMTVVAAPIGLGLLQFSKFLMSPFYSSMISKEDINEEQNEAWATYSKIVTVLYLPLGLLFFIFGIFQVVAMFLSIIGIPVAVVIAKSLGTYLNPVNKKCVHYAVAEELERIAGQKEIDKVITKK